jgi:hypothetical protein
MLSLFMASFRFGSKKNPLPAIGLITDFFLVWMVRLGHYQPVIPAADEEARYEDANKANNDEGAGNHRVPDRIGKNDQAVAASP